MVKKIVLHSLLMGFLAMNIGCKDKEEVDTTLPTLEAISVAKTVKAGEKLNLSFTAKDNTALGQVKVEMHDAFDLHGHGRLEEGFTFSKVYTLTGTSQNIQETISITADAPSGVYHLILNCIDAEGNEAEETELEVEITNDSQPILTLISPDPSKTVVVTKGQSITFTGTIKDTEGINKVAVALSKKDSEEILSFGKREFSPAQKEFDISILPALSIPNNLAAGDYVLKIIAYDVVGNTKSTSISITVK